MNDKPTLRRTEIQALLSCSAWENDNSEAAAFGSLVHRIIAAWAEHGDELIVSDYLREPCGVDPSRFDEVRDLVARFTSTHSLHWVGESERLLRVETEHAFIEGTPDRVDFVQDDAGEWSVAVVTDWKTGWQITDATFQLRFYSALLAVSMPELRTVHGRADFIRLGDGVVEYGPWDAAELRTWFQREIVDRVPALLAARETPTPTGGSACQYCRARLTCGASVAPARDAPETADDADRMVADLIRLDATVDAHRKALRTWFAEREATVVNGMEVGFLSSKEPSFRPTAKATEIAEWLDQAGLNGDAVLAVDRAQIGKPLQRQLVTAGLGEMATGKPEFKSRRAS